MVKKCFLLLMLLLASFCGISQNRQDIDSLKHELSNAGNDTSSSLILSAIAYELRNSNPDSSVLLCNNALELARSHRYFRGEARALQTLASTKRIQGDFPTAMDLAYQGLEIAKKNQLNFEAGRCMNLLGNMYMDLDERENAFALYKKALNSVRLSEEGVGTVNWEITILSNIGVYFRQQNQLDSALKYFQEAIDSMERKGLREAPAIFSQKGYVSFLLGDYASAMVNSHRAIQICENNNDSREFAYCCHTIALYFQKLNQQDSAIYFANKGYDAAAFIGFPDGQLVNANLLSELFKTRDSKKAFYFLNLARTLNDSIYGKNKIRALQKILVREQQQQRDIEAKQVAYRNRLTQYGFLAGLFVLLLIAFLLYRNNLQKQKANRLLSRQKDEIQHTLVKLKDTQSQLIHAEKMASLGELTASIAHEIQNPLNFVNNFSELNRELLTELQEELEKNNLAEAKILVKGLNENEEKINQHGKRADTIVKGMLQHSKSSSGEKESTGVNALVDEYLRLAYHGLKAKYHEVNINLLREFDTNVGKANMYSQDIGRVLLNVYHNAFHAVMEKKKKDEYFVPEIAVSTKKQGDRVEIRVKDNGPGMSEKIKEKIFQPFFTTKPTGQGTGLGLSLSYDIIKAHHGEVRVETTEGSGSEFIILLPVY